MKKNFKVFISTIVLGSCSALIGGCSNGNYQELNMKPSLPPGGVGGSVGWDFGSGKPTWSVSAGVAPGTTATVSSDDKWCQLI